MWIVVTEVKYGQELANSTVFRSYIKQTGGAEEAMKERALTLDTTGWIYHHGLIALIPV